MVKADVRRDYYGDLGLTPSADAEDIKKQFRKLALKYHPDRNPGRELEFNAKFQAIQAAHEILSDPHHRLKYDTDRLRAGYGKLYGPPKANTPRRAPANPYPSTPTANPHPSRPPFPGRPQSFHNGPSPSTGAQRFASYARAAPKQPWEKMQDEGQTRADAYRGFQEMKGNSTPGWSNFDPRTGRAGYPGTAPRPDATPNGQSTRPKSAYEYFKASPKPTSTESTRTQSTRKKQGFAPRTAGGDEPMAPNTSSYTSVPRRERFPASNPVFEPAPSPTAKKPTEVPDYHAENSRTSDFERTGSRYAGTGGERTFFSSAWLGRSESRRNSPDDHSQTNPPNPTPAPPGQHQSAGPQPRKERAQHDTSTSSSGTEEEEFRPRKPNIAPKSQRPAQRFAYPNSKNGGHDSAEAASSENAFGAFSSNPTSAHKTRHNPLNGTFRSSSHNDLRNAFASDNWGGDFGFGAFSDDSLPRSNHGLHSRGRASTRVNPPGARQAGGDQSSTASASQQQPTPFAKARFLADEWAPKLKDLKFAMPNSEEARQQANIQRQRSPRKQTRAGVRLRPTPQPASVATEAEESRATVGSDNKQETTNASPGDAEAMDLDDEAPAGDARAVPEPEQASKDQAKEMPPPPSKLSSGIGINITEPEQVSKDQAKEMPPPPSKLSSGIGINTTEPEQASKNQATEMPPPPFQPSSGAGTNKYGPKTRTRYFNLTGLGATAPFTSTNNGGIEDLQDIHATLPFESRPKVPRTTIRDVRPRQLICPNPPKRPNPPELVPISAGSQQLGLPRIAWNRYVAEMNAYVREWNAFSRRLLGHFNARQVAMETGMAPNWIGAVGDSTRLKIDEPTGEDDERENQNTDGHESDDTIMAGSVKAGYSAYLRALDEDEKVHKHWEVAREMHRECIVKLGQMRQWILDGGKLI